MKTKVYVQIEESPSSGYISINDMVLENNISKEYEYAKERCKHFGFTNKMESLEGFKLKYILIEVEYDGRKKSIDRNDILKSLEKHNLANKVGESMFGGYYLPTDQLKTILEKQLNERKELVNQGLYEKIG